MRSAFMFGSATLCAAISGAAFGDDILSNPFFKDSTTQVVARNFYFNRDFRNAASNAQSYREEWAQGFIGTFTSGFTPGTVGFGVDAIGLYGMKLDSSSDRIGSGLLPSSGNHVAGVDHAADDYSRAAGAVKIKISKTVLKYGQQTLNLPVYSTGDSRLLPETTEGFYLSSKEIDNLRVDVAHLTSLSVYNQSAHNAGGMTKADVLGATYNFTPNLTGALYASDVEDLWKKKYAGLSWVKPIDAKQTFSTDFRFYNQKSTGAENGGDIDSNSFSIKGAYAYGSHKVTLAYQAITGKNGYVFYTDGGNTDYMANYVQYAEFTREDERSWQARYDFNFAAFGVPGLDVFARYIKGNNISLASGASNQNEWERDLEAAYVIQSGPMKNLSFRVRQATYRNSFNGDIDDVRFITQYPINL
ncbi:OprD family porin [Pseudomonas sp. DSP3-2-2]|uniref:OprD family porin n=1 Tax=unclassified Pseudomonas TaxID=196821 RepID=UPI003CFA8F5C